MAITEPRVVVVDYKLPKQLETIRFLQYDTNGIKFVIENNGEEADLSNLTKIAVNFRRPDKKVISQELEAEENVITYQLTDSEMVKPGTCELVLHLYDDEERLTIAKFKVIIDENIEDGSTPTIEESRYIVQLLEEARDSLENVQTIEADLEGIQEELAARVKTVNGVEPDELGNVSVEADLESIFRLSENLIDPAKRKDGFALRYSYNSSTPEDYDAFAGQTTYEETLEGARYDVIYSNSPGRLVWYSAANLVSGNTGLVYDEALGLYKATISTAATKFKVDAYLSNIAQDGYWFVCKSPEYSGTKTPFGTKKLKSDIKSDAFAEKSEIQSLVSEIESLKGSSDLTFFVPNELYCYTSNQNNKWINTENVLVGQDMQSYYIKHTAGWYLQDFGRLKTQNADQITVVDKRTNSTKFTSNYQRRAVNPTTKTNPPTKKNILMIGDSLSDAGFIPCDVKRQITIEHGFTNFEFIGTKSDTVGDVTCLNEGRGGYSITDFTKNSNAQGRGASYPNPFLVGGTVSMANYMSQNAFTGNLDYCIIELGVNNNIALEQSPEAIKDELKKLVDQILASYPNCKIFVCGLAPISKINGEKSSVVHNALVLNINKAYQELCSESTYVNKCIYVDLGVFFDTYAGYPMVNEPYRGSTLERMVVTDWLHPSEAGYYMMADTIASAFIYHM